MSQEPLHEAEIAHHVPGRLRLKVPGAKGNPDALDGIRQSLASMPGLREISSNPVTGSVLVIYDEQHHETVRATVEHYGRKHISMRRAPVKAHVPKMGHVTEVADMIEGEAEFLAEHSHAARIIVNFCRDVDGAVKRASGNAVDLKVLVPLGLAVITFLEIGAAAATPVWMTLGLFSMNHFVELHAHDADPDEAEDEKEDAEAAPQQPQK